MDLRDVEPGDLPLEVGRFTLLKVLGEGGMARVFGAEVRAEGGFRKPVALKVIVESSESRRRHLAEQMVHEARLGALLNHPNVVQVHDFGVVDGFPFVAMELVEGLGVDRVVAYRPLSPRAAVDLAAQAAAGLHHAHTASADGALLHIVHRDVKPSNLLVRPDGVVKVADFGVAKAQLEDSPATTTGLIKGTVCYLSPEQLGGEAATPRSDLFALGASLWFALTSRALFDAGTVTELMAQIARVDDVLMERGLFAEAEAFVPGLGEVMGRLLAADPDERYQDGAQASAALQALAGAGRVELASQVRALMDTEATGVREPATRRARLGDPPTRPAPDVTVAAAPQAPSGLESTLDIVVPKPDAATRAALVDAVPAPQPPAPPPPARPSPATVQPSADRRPWLVAAALVAMLLLAAGLWGLWGRSGEAPVEPSALTVAPAAPRVSGRVSGPPLEPPVTPPPRPSPPAARPAAQEAPPPAEAQPAPRATPPSARLLALPVHGEALADPAAAPPAPTSPPSPSSPPPPSPIAQGAGGFVMEHASLQAASPGESLWIKARLEAPGLAQVQLHLVAGELRRTAPMVGLGRGVYGASITIDGALAEGFSYWIEASGPGGEVHHGSAAAPHRVPVR